MADIPPSHPRFASLRRRERLIDGFRAGLATEAGLLAHGRGEALDYLLGEQTHSFADEAIRTASAMLVCARYPVFSVNGNSASAAGPEIIQVLAAHGDMAAEVNLFHHSPERSRRIHDYLRGIGASHVFESVSAESQELPEIQHARRFMNQEGIARADVVLVALEDGDRCQALVRSGRTVIAIDLNPLSRTAKIAQVAIVDEISRALPLLAQYLREERTRPRQELEQRIASYDNNEVLRSAERVIRGSV
jgi:4-phosphopantoate--beta-alanine ligase